MYPLYASSLGTAVFSLEVVAYAPSYNGSMSDTLTIAGRAFQSRLIVGTGKYRSFQEMARCHAATGAEMAVSYTHLDVYKRQPPGPAFSKQRRA